MNILGAVAVMIFGLFAVNTNAQSLISAASDCYNAALGSGISQSRAFSIAETLQDGFQSGVTAFCETILSSSSPVKGAILDIAAQAFSGAVGSKGDADCTYSLAIATCSASAEAGNTLSLADASAIVESAGNAEATAICRAIADANDNGGNTKSQAVAGAKALLEACSFYGPDRSFVAASSEAFVDIGVNKAIADAASLILQESGPNLAMAAAKACGRALGLKEPAIEAAATARASALASLGSSVGVGGSDLSASAGSSALASLGLSNGGSGSDSSASAGSSALASLGSSNGGSGFDSSASAGSSASASLDSSNGGSGSDSSASAGSSALASLGSSNGGSGSDSSASAGSSALTSLGSNDGFDVSASALSSASAQARLTQIASNLGLTIHDVINLLQKQGQGRRGRGNRRGRRRGRGRGRGRRPGIPLYSK